MNRVPQDGMVITESTTFEPGVYYLPHGITIAADGVTLDGKGAVLVGSDRTGRGVTVENRTGVRITNLRLRDYYHGVYADHASHLTIANCQITSTGELAPNTVFLDIWLPVEQAYGGAILLHQAADSVVEGNDLQHQMCGLLTYQCQRLTVRGNVADYNSGYGFHLYETSDSLFEDNWADYCCRYEPRGPRKGHMGSDATGFLIVYKSCRNVFRRNNARLGGDGFFLAGLSAQGEQVGCDDNVFEQNDGSYSPNNGFESTFNRGTIFRDNVANSCNYGFWLGFSSENVLDANVMRGNIQAGIAVENGTGFRVTGNTFEANAHGILLWSKYIADFARLYPHADTSRDWLIEGNHFRQNRKAIRIAANQDHGIRPYAGSDPGGSAPHPHSHVVRQNSFAENGTDFDLVDVDGTLVEDNV